MQVSQPELQALVSRLDHLESQNRGWKIAATLFGLSTVSLLLLAAKPADRLDPNVIHARTVEAQDFVLRDADGQVRARLTLNPRKDPHDPILNGDIPANPFPRPSLQFYNDNGDAFWTVPQFPGVIPTH